MLCAAIGMCTVADRSAFVEIVIVALSVPGIEAMKWTTIRVLESGGKVNGVEWPVKVIELAPFIVIAFTVKLSQPVFLKRIVVSALRQTEPAPKSRSAESIAKTRVPDCSEAVTVNVVSCAVPLGHRYSIVS